MSRPRYYWNGYIKQTLMRYPEKLDEHTMQGRIAIHAISTAIAKTAISEYGDERLRFIDMVYFSKTHTLGGACMVIGISDRTGQRWSQEFFNIVSEHMGFSEKVA